MEAPPEAMVATTMSATTGFPWSPRSPVGRVGPSDCGSQPQTSHPHGERSHSLGILNCIFGSKELAQQSHCRVPDPFIVQLPVFGTQTGREGSESVISSGVGALEKDLPPTLQIMHCGYRLPQPSLLLNSGAVWGVPRTTTPSGCHASSPRMWTSSDGTPALFRTRVLPW